MNSKDNIEQLQHIRKVEAPAYLLDRIHARIDEQKKDNVSPSWALSLAAAIALLTLFNVMHLRNDVQQASTDVATELTSTMNLMPSNQLYYE